MRKLLHLHAARDASGVSDSRKAELDEAIARNKKILLRRSWPIELAPRDLAYAPVERQLETILASSFLENMPAQSLSVIHRLALNLASRLMKLDERRYVVYPFLQHALLPDGQEFWEPKAEILSAIRYAYSEEVADKLAIDYLFRAPKNGIEAMAQLFLVRDILRAIHYTNLIPDIAKKMEKVTQRYRERIKATKPLMLAHVDRHRLIDEQPFPPAPGIIALNQTSAVDTGWMQPSVRPLMGRLVDPQHPHTAAVLRSGNVAVTGLSGTTNIIVGLAGTLDPDMFASSISNWEHLTVTLAAILIYAGGHSVNEVFEVAAMDIDFKGRLLRMCTPDGTGEEDYLREPLFDEPQNYDRLSARLLLRTLLARIGLPELVDAALRQLVAHFQAHPEELEG